MTWTAPSQDPAAWGSLVVIAFGLTFVLPGLTTISGNARKIPFDKKAASGQKGATTERKGEPPAEFTSTHLLTDEPWPASAADVPEGRAYVDDFYQWAAAELLLKKAYAGEEPVALSLYHPDLERQGIDAATVEEISGLTDNGNGSGTISVKWLEYRPPTPTGDGGASTPKKKSASEEAIDREIEEGKRLDKEYEDL